jgi:hypothetical protein
MVRFAFAGLPVPFRVRTGKGRSARGVDLPGRLRFRNVSGGGQQERRLSGRHA